MKTLYIPLHLPLRVARDLLSREVGLREVTSVKVTRHCMVIEHERMSYEAAAELLSLLEQPIVV